MLTEGVQGALPLTHALMVYRNQHYAVKSKGKDFCHGKRSLRGVLPAQGQGARPLHPLRALFFLFLMGKAEKGKGTVYLNNNFSN